MKNLFNRFVREEQGQDLIEYALLAGFISLVAVVAITNVGSGVNKVYDNINTQVGSIPGAAVVTLALRGDGWRAPSPAVETFKAKKGQMKRLLGRALRDDSAQDLIEYALLAAFVSIIAVAAITSIGTR